MATEIDRLRIIIEADNKATAALESVKASVMGLAGAYISFQGAMMAARAAISALKEAESAAAENVRLSVTMRLAGIEASGQAAAVHALNSELAKNTTFTDDAIARAQSYLITIGNLSGRGLDRATRAAADLAAAMGTDIAEAARLVATATDGTSRAFQLLGVSINDAMTPGEKFEALLGAIETKLKGVSTEIADVSPWGQWGKAIGEANESLGRFIGNLVLIRGIGGQGATVNDYLKGLTDHLNALNSAGAPAGGNGNGIARIAQSAADANAQFIPLIDALRQIRVEMVSVDAEAPTILDEQALAASAAELRRIVEMLEAMHGPLTAAAQGALDMAAAEKTIWDEINQGGKQTDEQFIQVRNSAFDVLAGLEAWQGPLTLAQQKLQRMNDNLALQRDIYGQLIDRVGDLGASITRAALNGQSSFGEFFKQFFIDIAAAIVKALILAIIMTVIRGVTGGAGSFLADFLGALAGQGLGRVGGGSRVDPGGTAPAPSGPGTNLLPSGQQVGAVINNRFGGGVNESFISELLTLQNDFVRRRGFRVVASEVA